MLKAPFVKNSGSAKLTTSGQSLIEILVGIGVGVIIIGGVAATIALTLRSNVQNKNNQIATSLAQEVVSEVSDFAGANWHNLDNLSTGLQYHLATSGPNFSAQSGIETFTVEGKVFTRYFVYNNVSRDAATDNIESSYNSANNDPSTKKLTVTVSWPEGPDTASVALNKFLTRSKSLVFRQTDWSGAAGQVGPITSINNRYASTSNLDTTTCVNSGDPNPATNRCIKVQGF